MPENSRSRYTQLSVLPRKKLAGRRIQTGVYFFRSATTRRELFSKDFTLLKRFLLNGNFARLLGESRCAMLEDKRNEWMRLCELASGEQDFEKLLELTNEILRLTEPKRKSFQTSPDHKDC